MICRKASERWGCWENANKAPSIRMTGAIVDFRIACLNSPSVVWRLAIPSRQLFFRRYYKSAVQIPPVSCVAMYDAAYQGSRGAFSEDAAFKLLTPSARLLPRDTLEDVFNAVARDEARFAVVPIENTLAGSIHRCYDLLFEHDLKIASETVCHIVHALIAPPGVAFHEIRKALSHPVALAQCELFFRKHPQIQAVSVYDTAGAVESIMREGRRESAAVASRRAAEVYGGAILADAIQDHPENYTRFLLMTPSASMAPEQRAAEYKTTIVFSVGNIPGALYHSLRPFAERGV